MILHFFKSLFSQILVAKTINRKWVSRSRSGLHGAISKLSRVKTVVYKIIGDEELWRSFLARTCFSNFRREIFIDNTVYFSVGAGEDCGWPSLKQKLDYVKFIVRFNLGGNSTFLTLVISGGKNPPGNFIVNFAFQEGSITLSYLRRFVSYKNI